MKRALAILLGLALASIGTMAVAAWLSSASGTGTAWATSVNQANAPTATRGTGKVILNWEASTLADGSQVGGYRVVRHHNGSTTDVCAVSGSNSTCDDITPVAGSVTYGVIATVGANWEGPESPTTAFTYDDIAPVTTASVDPVPNGAGWNKTSVTVALTATDNASSVDHIAYTIDSGSQVTVNAATTSFTVSGAGGHTVTYFAVDGVGNTETTRTRSIHIDPNAPTTSVTRNPAPNAAGWHRTDVNLNFTATDPGTGASGISTVTVDGVSTSGSTASKSVTAEGATSVPYFATDVADNVEANQSVTVRIDKTAPGISGLDPSDGEFSKLWSDLDCATQSDRVCVNVTDATSGVSSVGVQLYRQSGWGFGSDACWSGTAWVTGSCPFLPMELVSGSQYRLAGTAPSSAFSNSQPYRTTYRATDVAGNSSSAVATFKVDAQAPTASIFPDGTWRKSGLVQVSGFDPLTGIASVSYRVDANSGAFTTVQVSGSPLSGSTTFTLAAGSHTVDYFATDSAGNVSATVNNAPVNIDQTAPTIDGFDPAEGASGKWNQVDCNGSNDRLCVTISDSQSGVDVARVFWSLSRTTSSGTVCWNGSSFAAANCGPMMSTMVQSGSTWRTPVLSAAVMSPGSYAFSVSADDAVGNSAFNNVRFTVTP